MATINFQIIENENLKKYDVSIPQWLRLINF